MKDFICKRLHSITLSHITNPETGTDRKQGKQYRKPFLFHPPFDGIHGTAMINAFGIRNTEFNGKKSFGILCGNSKNTAEPTPEHCSGTTGNNCSGDSDNVAGTDCGCKGYGQRTELRNLPFLVRIFHNTQLDPEGNVTLNKF